MECTELSDYNGWNPNSFNIMHQEHLPTASLYRQLAAMLYDGFLIFSLFFVVLGIFVIFKMDSSVALADSHAIDKRVVWLTYLGTTFLFYAWFWQKSGQTLGMRVWKIKIISELGGNPHWLTSLIRLGFAILSMACLGLGYLWLLFKPYSWHDKFSQTRVVFVGNEKSTKGEGTSD